MNTKHFKLPGRRRATTTEDLGVIRKFSIGSKPLSSFIAHFDDSNSGYVPQEGGNDPVGGMPGDITGANVNPARSVPDDNELEFLAGLAGLHQSIIDKINAHQAKASINRDGSTGPVRQISRPKTAGSRGDLLP
jgi:hypothetical protein